MASGKQDPSTPPHPRGGVSAGEETSFFVAPRRGPENKLSFLALRVVTGRDMFRFVTLPEGSGLVIGRGGLEEDHSLVLTDASVSRSHARVTRGANGEVHVEDLNSTNGTAVNGLPITRSELRVGEQLEVGGVSLRLEHLNLDEISHLEKVLERLEARNRDPLTGLLTRAWLDDELPRMVSAAEASGNELTCLFVDIDNFKSINDRFGHQVGDDVLVAVARLLMVGIRETDACVRYGGEELVMFLGATAEPLGADVADRIRSTIQGHNWSRTLPDLSVTVSVGVSTRRDEEPIKEWIKRADRALYAAKGRGRNRVVRASTLPD
jgi:diguanylate cyclase (GGDEF)-like protein